MAENTFNRTQKGPQPKLQLLNSFLRLPPPLPPGGIGLKARMHMHNREVITSKKHYKKAWLTMDRK